MCEFHIEISGEPAISISQADGFPILPICGWIWWFTCDILIRKIECLELKFAILLSKYK